MKHYLGESPCSCGRKHEVSVDKLIVGNGVIGQIPEVIGKYGASKPFILADKNTYAAAGKRVCALLTNAGIPFGRYIFPQDALEPDEHAVGSAVMHFDPSCDLVIAVGSGVLNDIGKILSNVTGKKYIIVATAPSMDGYASATSSVALDGLKTSLPSRCADCIIGDIEILKAAPIHMLRAGLGDMLAKYISIAEWRIGNLITGEYYCEAVAQLIRNAVKKCVDNAEGLLNRENKAVKAVFEGLVIGGVAMAYAGVSRPASGVEHYFSHIWDMRGLEFGTNVDLHGIQCAVATYACAGLYEHLSLTVPNANKAKSYAESFDLDSWHSALKHFVGSGADAMIALEAKEGKYATEAHALRLEKILSHWDDILEIISQEIPKADEIGRILDQVGICKSLSSLGIDKNAAKMTFFATKDIRDKYVLSRLAWDLGIIEEIAEYL